MGRFEDIPQRVKNGEFDLCRLQPDWRNLEMGINTVFGERLYEVPQKPEHDSNTFWPLSDYGAGVAAVLLDPAYGDVSEYKKGLKIILDSVDFSMYDSRGDVYICAAYFMC